MSEFTEKLNSSELVSNAWDEIVFGSEIKTMASKMGGDWDEPTGVNFELIDIKTAIDQETIKMYSIEAKIAKYENLL